MLCRIVFCVVVIALVMGINAGSATAQTCVYYASCGAYSLNNVSCLPPLPPGASQCQVEGPWLLVCEVVAPCNLIPPPSYCPTCGKGQAAGGQPINLSNGNTYIQQMDVRVPGLGNGLALQRTWNSIWPSTISAFQTGMFGANWRSTYEERVFKNNNYMIYLRGDGGFWVFSQTGASTWNLISPASVIATLTQNGTQSWTIAFQNGEQRIFNYTSGSLSSIIDPNGNATQLIYDATNRLVTVTDPANRHLYFAYGNGSNNLLVTGVTSDAAQSWAYTYDSQNRLTVVTRPDQTTNTFVYNSQSLISQVLDSNGRVLEAHTYDASGRGATSSRANGVETVTVSYPN